MDKLHMCTDATPAKVRRRPGSFVLKITFGQFFRMLSLILGVNLLSAVLYIGLLLGGLEQTAQRIIQAPSIQEAAGYAPYLLEDTGVTVKNQQPPPGGIGLDPWLEERLGLVQNAKRRFVLQNNGPNPALWNYEIWPEYSISVPVDAGQYATVTFSLSTQLRRFCIAGVLLVTIELFILMLETAGVRRSVRNVLAPIQQLADVAHTISAEQSKPSRISRKDTPPEKLELSGTIDTLNQITAKHLDTRIAINDERVELQGLARAINDMLDRLDAAYSSQLRFVSDASHELRTPIAVIQGYANLLDRWGKEDPATLQESIAAIKSEAEGMQALVEQLLFLARSDNNSIVLQLQTLDISEIAAEVLRDTQIIDHAHVFVSDIDPALWVEGDSGLLKQAMRIFMDNAVKYTPAGERIKVSVKGEKDSVQVSVTDNGIGIPEEDLPFVFQRFYRSDESRARATGGTGLGLSIAKWTVQRHGGHLEILSRQDIGTRLTMVLPMAQVSGDAAAV